MLFIHEFHFHISHISHHILLEFLRNCLFFFFHTLYESQHLSHNLSGACGPGQS